MHRSNTAHDRPSQVAAEEGEVLVDGPGGLAMTMTPEAAEETARRLLDAASEARGQSTARNRARPEAAA